MKRIINVFKNMQAFSFIVGMSVGAAIGLVLFCYMVPHGPKAIAMLRHYTAHMRGEQKIAQKNRDDFQSLYMNHGTEGAAMNHDMNSPNPYVMSTVISEKQFLQDMTLHHEAAIVMAKQVLVLPNLHPEVKQLAEAIIQAQTSEVTQMKSWMKMWK